MGAPPVPQAGVVGASRWTVRYRPSLSTSPWGAEAGGHQIVRTPQQPDRHGQSEAQVGERGVVQKHLLPLPQHHPGQQQFLAQVTAGKPLDQALMAYLDRRGYL